MTDDQSLPQNRSIDQSADEIGAALDRLHPYLDRLDEDFDRLIDLTNLYVDLNDGTLSVNDDLKRRSTDILRAVVVFTHALLEDFLRTLASTVLPNADERRLNTIPLAGLGNSGRAEKFFLGKLLLHKGKLVDDVISESVSEYLDRSTFNSIDDIASLLQDLGLNPAEHNEQFALISALIERRHRIVHRGDKVKKTGSEQYQLEPINGGVVIAWTRAAFAFTSSVLRAAIKMFATKTRLLSENKSKASKQS